MKSNRNLSSYLEAQAHPALHPYQVEGAAFLASRKNAALWDEMGLGKTVQAIGACDLINADKVLIACPAVAMWNWKREFERWQMLKRRVIVLRARPKNSTGAGRAGVYYDVRAETARDGAPHPVPSMALEDVYANFDVLIVSYDRAHRKDFFNNAISQFSFIGGVRKGKKHAFDVLICDEAHFLKTRTAKRTQAIYGKAMDMRTGLAAACERVWTLTGTPAPNNPSELWTHMKANWPETLKQGKVPLDYWRFVDTFCVTRETPFGVQIVGGKKLAKLKSLLADHTLRRRKDQVALPPITIGILPLATEGLTPGNGTKNVKSANAEAKKAMGSTFLQTINDARIELQRGDDNTPALDAMLQAHVADEHLTTMRRLTGVAKAHAMVKYLATMMEDTRDAVVLFGIHKEVLDVLQNGLSKFGAVRVDGRTAPEARDAAVQKFQKGEARVFIGNLQAAGTAITLTAASDIFIVEASWVPAENSQAIMRVHRLGQKKPVLARFVSMEESVDELVTRVLARKTRTLTELFDGDDEDVGDN